MYDYGLKTFAGQMAKRQLHLYGALVLRHGRTVGECHWVNDQPFHLFSLSKSFTGIAVGMAIDEGLLSLESRPADLLAPHMPQNPDEKLLALKAEHLLRMASGHGRSCMTLAERDAIPSTDWLAYYLSQPMVHAPGAAFVYDTGDTYALAAMLQAAAGETVLSYLNRKLFAPLGIPTPRWDACPRGIPLAGAGLYLTLQDVAKFGQLLLQEGAWDGRQLVSREWVRLATQKHMDTSQQTNPELKNPHGYGYQFWLGEGKSFYGMGALGQLCLVLPEEYAVVAVHAYDYHFTEILPTVRETIVPMLRQHP